MPFLITSVILSILAIIEKKSTLSISVVIVAFYFSFTYGYGFDWINYMDVYNNIDNKLFGQFFFNEPVYLLLMRVFSWFGLPFSIFNACVTLCIYLCAYLFCRKLNNPNLAFFTLFSFLGLYVYSEWIRQGLALSLIMFNMSKNDNKKVNLIIICIASLIHAGAILAIFINPLIKSGERNLKKILLLMSLFVGCIIFLIYNPEVALVIPVYGQKIYNYGVFFTSIDTGLLNFILSSKVILGYILIIAVFCWVNPKTSHVYSSIISLYAILLTRLIQPLIRIGYYFLPALISSVDGIDKFHRKGKKTPLIKIAYIFLVLGVSTIPFWNALFGEGSQYYLNITSSKTELISVISKKCEIINANTDYNTIYRCN